MQDAIDSTHEAPAPFPIIRAMLKNKRLVIGSGTAGVCALGFWLAFRTGVIDLYPITIVLALVVHLIMKVAVEVIELVAETLMPR